MSAYPGKMRGDAGLVDRALDGVTIVQPRRQRHVKLRDYCGALHVHSNYSDGDAPIPEILKAAADCRLDYVLLTDHVEMGLCDPVWQQWHGPVLLVLGCEVSPDGEPHTLALRLDDTEDLQHLSPPERLKEIEARRGHNFIAHPKGHDMAFMHIPAWADWQCDHFTGIEVWSYTYDWLADFRWRRAISAYRRPHELITGPDPDTLAIWDRFAMRRQVSGIAGTDAHARPILSKRLKVFPYEMMFQTTLTHVLCEEFTHDARSDARAVNDALIEGRCYMAYHVLGDPAGFRFAAEGDHGVTEMGERVALESRPVLKVELPTSAEITLVANGRTVRRREADHAEFRPVGTGPCRIEVRRGGKPWVYSNHIHVV